MGSKMPKSVADTDITVLYEPKNSKDCFVDIVFVHGLGGHPKRTWTYTPHANKPAEKVSLLRRFTRHAGSSASAEAPLGTQSEVFWPETILPEDCPSARIMTWGYNSNVTNFFRSAANHNSFYEHANDLLYALERQRAENRERPLIFVMHSLGGIIVKQALLDSNLADGKPDLQLIESSTVGLVFLGTPHRGSDLAGWGKIASAIASAAFFDVNRTNIDVLQAHGEQLAQLEKSFGRIVMRQDIRIHNFYESQGIAGIKGLNRKVVEAWSASIGNPGRESTETIDANHMDMCRFSGREDRGYVKVGYQISSQVKEIKTQKVEELANEYDDTLTSLATGVTVGVPPHVGDPESATLTWLALDHRLCSWFQYQHGLFAIKGKAGSGKSTIMKHLFESRVIEDNADTSDTIKTCFFFNEQGLPQDKAMVGMLRALLWHFLDLRIELYESIAEQLRFEARRSRAIASIEWTPKLLRNLLKSIVRLAKRKTMFIFVDALDECSEQDRTPVISFLHDLYKTGRDSGAVINICLSSRPEGAIDMDLSEVLTGSMLLQNENHRDIAIYVNKALGSKHDPRRRKNYYANFAAKIAEKADGVFLWVILVIPTLRTAIARGKTELELNRLLEQIPQELKSLYRGILNKIDVDALRETMRMLQIAALAQRPLYIDEFWHALVFDANSRFNSLTQWHDSPEYIEADFMAQARIQSGSGGLLEVCKASEDRNEQSTSRRRAEFRNFYDQNADPSSLPNLPRSPLQPNKEATGDGTKFKTASGLQNPLWDHLVSDTGPGDLAPMESPSRHPSESELYPISWLGKQPNRESSMDGDNNTPFRNLRHRHTLSQPPRRNRMPHAKFSDKSDHSTTLCWKWSDSQYIRSQCHGDIADEEREPSKQVIRLIHETAKHFFVKGDGFPILFELIQERETRRSLSQRGLGNPYISHEGSYITGGHEHMVQTFLSYLNLSEIRHLTKNFFRQGKLQDLRVLNFATFPLLVYISEHWLTHISEADGESGSQKWVLARLISYAPGQAETYICWAARHHIISWIDAAEELGIDVDTPTVAYGRPIMDAVLQGDLAIVARLIKAGANVNGVTGGMETTLRYAERLRDQDMVTLLRNSGAGMEQMHYLPPTGKLVRLDTTVTERFTARISNP